MTIDKTYQPAAVEGRIYAAWEAAGAFRAGRPERAKADALLHRHSAAQCDRLAAHGARAQQYLAGHSLPLRAHARQGRALAARHRSRRHRHPGRGRAAIDGAPGARQPRNGARSVHQARVGMEGGIRRRDHRPTKAARRLVRLVARALHHGRRPVARRGESVRRALSRRPHLQGQAAGQLGPEAQDRDLRSGSAAGRDQGLALVHQVSDRRQRRVCRGGDDAA